jgi:hypothetical protein
MKIQNNDNICFIENDLQQNDVKIKNSFIQIKLLK